jgi:hypothetical protein
MCEEPIVGKPWEERFWNQKKKTWRLIMSRLHSIVRREPFDHHLFNYWRSPMFWRLAGSPPITIVGYSVQIIALMDHSSSHLPTTPTPTLKVVGEWGYHETNILSKDVSTPIFLATKP